MNTNELASAFVATQEDIVVSEDMLSAAADSLVSQYGVEKATVICMEELAELTQVLSKVIRGKFEPKSLAVLEEIADVYLAVNCFCHAHGISKTDLERVKYIKADRIINKGV